MEALNKMGVKTMVLNPHPFHADPDPNPAFKIFPYPDPGFEIFADPDSGIDFYQKFVFLS